MLEQIWERTGGSGVKRTREEEIEKFIPEEYWNIYVTLLDEKSKKTFEAHLYEKNGKKLEIHKQEEVDKILQDIKNAKYIINDIPDKLDKLTS